MNSEVVTGELGAGEPRRRELWREVLRRELWPREERRLEERDWLACTHTQQTDMDAWREGEELHAPQCVNTLMAA